MSMCMIMTNRVGGSEESKVFYCLMVVNGVNMAVDNRKNKTKWRTWVQMIDMSSDVKGDPHRTHGESKKHGGFRGGASKPWK